MKFVTDLENINNLIEQIEYISKQKNKDKNISKTILEFFELNTETIEKICYNNCEDDEFADPEMQFELLEAFFPDFINYLEFIDTNANNCNMFLDIQDLLLEWFESQIES